MIRKRHLQRLVILAGVFVTFGCRGRNEPEGRPTQAVSGVEIATVNLEAVPKFYGAVGTVRPLNTSLLSAQLGGTVRAVLVKAGDKVRRGQLLATLDERAPQAQLRAAEAGVRVASQGLAEVRHALQAAQAQRQFAEATYKRYQNLLAENSVSRQEFDDTQTRYQAALASEQALQAKIRQVEAQQQQAEAQQSAAETTLSYARVNSPLNGVVTAKSVDAGTIVMPGAALLTVEDVSHYRLEASLPGEYLARVKKAEVVQVTVGGQIYSGPVAEIVPATDASSRTFTVKVSLPARCACQSGDYGTAAFPVGTTESLLIPKRALRTQGELVGAFVVNPQGVVDYRLVKTGEEAGDLMEVLAGLNAGERVAVSQVDRLRQGDRVEGR